MRHDKDVKYIRGGIVLPVFVLRFFLYHFTQQEKPTIGYSISQYLLWQCAKSEPLVQCDYYQLNYGVPNFRS
jgi:hypothetical protein